MQRMRLLLYNIRYAVGGGASMHVPLPGAGYVIGNQTVLPDITKFIKSVDPDIVGLIEVDTGSIRSRKVNQAEKIAADLGMNTSYETKYGEKSINQVLPIVRKQGNAFMAAPRMHGEKFHYFDTGIKRLIIELEMDGRRYFSCAPVVEISPSPSAIATPLRSYPGNGQARRRSR